MLAKLRAWERIQHVNTCNIYLALKFLKQARGHA